MPPAAVPSTSATHSAGRSSRIAPHSHIRGLGLRADGVADNEAAGFVGQNAAREVREITLYVSIFLISHAGMRHCGRTR